MRHRLLFALLLVVFYTQNAIGQRSLLSPSFSTPNDEVLIDYAHPKPNRLVFAAEQLNELSVPRWSDGIVFITDDNGVLIRQRSFKHAIDSASFCPSAMFTTDSTVELIGIDGYSVPGFEFPICHALRWIRMDTALNVLEEKYFPLATDRETIEWPLSVTRLFGYTYITFNQRYYYWDQNRVRPFLLRFDRAMNLITKRQFDPSFYGTALNVNGGLTFDISAHAASGTLFIPAEMRITSSTDSFYFPNDRILHKLDTALNLLDTFIYLPNSWTSNGYDTILAGNGVETLPLDEHRVWIGSSFMLSDVFKSIFREHVGLSLFNTTTGKYRHRQFAPNYDTSDRQSCVAVKGIAQDGAGHVYTLGASNCGDAYTPYDNALVLVKYDTSGTLLWHRFITSGSGYFLPLVVHCDGDSMVTILATRYNWATLFPDTYERDYYVVRLRADNGATVSIFPVRPRATPSVRAFPNPTSGQLHIESPAGSRARLYTPDGRLITEATTGAKQLDLTGLAAGIYILRITDAAGAVIKAERVLKVD